MNSHLGRVKFFATAIIVVMMLLGVGMNVNSQSTPLSKISTGQQERQGVGRPTPELMPYVQAIAAQSETPLSVSWSERTGTPSSLYGELSAANNNVSLVAATQFLADNAVLLGVNDLQELKLQREFASPMGQHYIFQQEYQGLTVYGAQTAVHFNQQGQVVALTNSYLPNVNVAVEPVINAAQALDITRRQTLATDLSQATSELLIYPTTDSYALAWRVTIPTNRRTWEMFVDAQSGQALTTPRDINRYVDGTGRVFRVNAVVATQNNALRDNNDAASAVPTTAYMTVTLPGLAGTGLLDGQFASSKATKRRVSNATNNFSFDRNNVGFSETMGYYYIDYAERYIQSLGFTNINNRQVVFSANGTTQDNSFYSPSTKQITFGTGGVDDAEDGEVVLHEYGHSMQDNQLPGYGSSLEAGSMGEGFGDYWGASVTAQLSNGFQDTCAAEWDATSYSSTNPPCLRRLDRTKIYPQSIVGQVHADGEIWSAALWQIRGAIGAARADKVILQSHFLVSTRASFNEGAQSVVTAARNLGYTATEVSSIITIMRNRGFTVN
jgi:Zn-dependent metalloprotease